MSVPWTARRSNQSIRKEISPGYSLEGLMLKLKLQYFGHMIRRADSLEKILMLGKIRAGGKEGTATEQEQQQCFPGGARGKEAACQCMRNKRHGRSLHGENPLEEGMATHSSIFAWRIPWIEEAGGL